MNVKQVDWLTHLRRKKCHLYERRELNLYAHIDLIIDGPLNDHNYRTIFKKNKHFFYLLKPEKILFLGDRSDNLYHPDPD